MREELNQIVLERLRVLLEELGHPSSEPISEETRLFGERAVLDSLGLVRLLADVEEAVSEQFGVDLVLADERAMSQTRSPFRRVRTLADFIAERIEETRANG